MPNEPAPASGPRRRAPAFYAGETYGRNRVQYPDVERRPNGALPSKRDKLARRVIRGALKKRFSGVSFRLAQGLRAQAYEATREDKATKRGRAARRLLAAELAIHKTVYVPTKPELRAMRTKIRAGQMRDRAKDAISELVERMATKP